MISPLVERFRATLDLYETGVELMRQNLRRARPEAVELEIDQLLHAWLTDRPGARDGDGEGTPIDFHLRRPVVR